MGGFTRLRRRHLVIAGAAATAAAIGAGVLLATSASAVGEVSAAFSQPSRWDSGYTGQYTITNDGTSAITSWKLVFDLPAGSSVASLWNGDETTAGRQYTVTGQDWDSHIPAGGSVHIGFEVDGTAAPTACTINGAACAASVPTAAPTTTTAAPTTAAPAPTTTTAAPAPPTTTTAAPTSAPPTTSSSGGSGSFGAFAPYSDLSLYPLYNLANAAAATGGKYFNLAFVVDGGGTCNPEWGGVTAIGDPSIGADIASLRAAGGDVRVSFGGQAGTELAIDCASASQLAAAYQKVISTYSLTRVDFDVEGAAIANTAANDRRNQAIATLERQDPGLQVSYTLPVLPSGLTSDGVALLQSAKNNGASIAAVNVMAMDYGSSFPSDMGANAENAASSTEAQIASVWTGLTSDQAWHMVAVTPMIGVNDDSAETFTLADASSLVSFAAQHHLAWLSFWSAARDTPCAGGAQGYASATCSSIVQSPYAFAKIFAGYSG